MPLRKFIFQNIIWRGMYFFSLFLLNIIVSRYFKADGSGEIYYIINNLSFISLVISLSLETGTTYYVSKNEINEGKVALFCLQWSVVATIICLFILHLTKTDPLNNVLSGKEFVFGCSAYLLGVLLTTFFTPLFFAKKDFMLPNLILLSLTSLMIVVLLAFGRNPFIHRHFVLIYFCSFLLQGFSIALIYCVQKKVFARVGFLSGYDLKRLFRYSLLAFLGNVIFFLVYRVDYWFVNKNCTVAELGNYIQVSKLVQVFLLIPTTVASAIFVNTASRKEQAAEPLKIISRWITLLYVLIICFLAILGRSLFPMIYGRTFDLMYLPFLLLSPGVLALSTITLLAAYYAGIGKVIVNVKGAFYALLFVVPGDFFFTPKYGINAAAIVSSVGYSFYLFYEIRCLKKEYRGTRAAEFFIPETGDIKFLKSGLFSRWHDTPE